MQLMIMIGVSDVFSDLLSLVLLQNCSAAVQWNDFKISFALSSSFLDFQNTQIFLGKP